MFETEDVDAETKRMEAREGVSEEQRLQEET